MKTEEKGKEVYEEVEEAGVVIIKRGYTFPNLVSILHLLQLL